ncbi:MAG: FMN-binding protein, partial [Planctomycetota bacterium]
FLARVTGATRPEHSGARHTAVSPLTSYVHHRDQYSGMTNEYLSLASCYEEYEEWDKAEAVLKTALDHLPKPPWKIAREADVYNHWGDLESKRGNYDKAKEKYKKAIQLYPTSNQPYGKHLLVKNVKVVQTKLDLLDYKTLDLSKIKNGVYKGSALGYKEDVTATVTVKDGKISDIKVEHKEDIEQNASVIVPELIVKTQSLKVDAVSGATTTSDAIVTATFEALKSAGLESAK